MKNKKKGLIAFIVAVVLFIIVACRKKNLLPSNILSSLTGEKINLPSVNIGNILAIGETYQMPNAVQIQVPTFSFIHELGFRNVIFHNGVPKISFALNDNVLYEPDRKAKERGGENNHPYRAWIYFANGGNFEFKYQNLGKKSLVYTVFDSAGGGYRVYYPDGLANNIDYKQQCNENEVASFSNSYSPNASNTNGQTKFLGFNPIYQGKIDLENEYAFETSEGWKDDLVQGWNLPYSYNPTIRVWQKANPSNYVRFVVYTGDANSGNPKISILESSGISISKDHCYGSTGSNNVKSIKITNNQGSIVGNSIISEKV